MSYSTRWLLSGLLVIGGILAMVAGFFTLPTDTRIGAGVLLVGIGILIPGVWWLRRARRGDKVPHTRTSSSFGVLVIAAGLALLPWSNLSLSNSSDNGRGEKQAVVEADTSVPPETRSSRAFPSSSRTSEEPEPSQRSSSADRESTLIAPKTSEGPELKMDSSPSHVPAPVETQMPRTTSDQRWVQPTVPSSPQTTAPTPSSHPSTGNQTQPTSGTVNQTTSNSSEEEERNEGNDEQRESRGESKAAIGEEESQNELRHLIPWLP